MKNLIFFTLLFAGFSLAFTGISEMKKVTVDLSNSAVTWKGAKVLKGSHHGEVTLKSVNLEVDGKKIISGNFEIDMTTINCLDLSGNSKQRLEGHLRSDDFFSVETYPTASFKITNATLKGSNQYAIKGDLTIKGKTHPIEFVANVSKAGSGTMFSANFNVDRTLYDVRFGSDKFFDNLGDGTIKDDFEIGVTLMVKESLI